MKNNKHPLLRSALLLAALFWTGSAFAAQGIIPQCKYLPLATNPITTGVQNTTACIDIPVNLSENHVVFSIDTPVTSDGTPSGTPVALRHMWLLGSAMHARIKAQKISAANVQIIGVIHGTALHWALSNAWWEAQVDDDGHQLYPNGNPYAPWIEKLFALNKEGVNVQLEVCGVTLSGAGLSNADVYSSPNGRIYVNQGALGRIIDLQQQGYALLHEGWIDNDKHMHRDYDRN